MAKVNDEVASYRTCFSTDAGKRVLGDILLSAGLWDDDKFTTEEIAVQNFAKTIIRKLGICKDPKDMGVFVQKLFELPNK